MDATDVNRLGDDFRIKQDDIGKSAIDPANVAEGEEVRRRPGRPRLNRDNGSEPTRVSAGSRSGDNKKTNNSIINADASLEGFARILSVFHAGLATITKIPEIELDADDAKAITTEFYKTLALYDVRIDPKIEQLAALVGVTGQIYAMKYLTYKLRIASEKKEE